MTVPATDLVKQDHAALCACGHGILVTTHEAVIGGVGHEKRSLIGCDGLGNILYRYRVATSENLCEAVAVFSAFLDTFNQRRCIRQCHLNRIKQGTGCLFLKGGCPTVPEQLV